MGWRSATRWLSPPFWSLPLPWLPAVRTAGRIGLDLWLGVPLFRPAALRGLVEVVDEVAACARADLAGRAVGAALVTDAARGISGVRGTVVARVLDELP